MPDGIAIADQLRAAAADAHQVRGHGLPGETRHFDAVAPRFELVGPIVQGAARYAIVDRADQSNGMTTEPWGVIEASPLACAALVAFLNERPGRLEEIESALIEGSPF